MIIIQNITINDNKQNEEEETMMNEKYAKLERVICRVLYK